MNKVIIVDANILFSFFYMKSIVRNIVIDSEHKYGLKFISPRYLFAELDKHKFDICKKAKINDKDYEFPRKVLELNILIYEDDFLEEFKDEAIKLLPNHTKDVAYLALALKLNCPIWSHDKNLLKQDKVKIISTMELLEELKNLE